MDRRKAARRGEAQSQQRRHRGRVRPADDRAPGPSSSSRPHPTAG